MFLNSFSDGKYEKQGNKIIIASGDKIREIEFRENGRKLISKFSSKISNKHSPEFSEYVFAFLNWDDL